MPSNERAPCRWGTIGILQAGLVGLAACGGGGAGGGAGGGGGGSAVGLGLALQADPASFESSEYRRSGALERVGASSAYAAGGDGSGRTIAVIDTGVDVDHPDLQPAILGASRDIVGGRGALRDGGGHGTRVAGLAVARRDGSGIHGAAHQARLLAIRADAPNSCPAACTFDQRDLADATDYAVAQGADILNYSLGSANSLSAAYAAAMADATAAGRLLVLAAGNEGAAKPSYPGLFAASSSARGRALVVGSVNASDKISAFSNRAGSARARYLVAPGENLRTTADGGGTATASGTSFATPTVSGAAAVLWDAAPHLAAEQVARLLLDTARDLGAPGVDSVYGHGLLDLEAAIRPQGAVVVPTGASVADGGRAIGRSGLVASAGFGRGLESAEPLIVLDGYDRAYEVRLGDMVTPSKGPEPVGLWLQRRARTTERAVLAEGGLRVEADSDPEGALRSLRIEADLSSATRLSFAGAEAAGGPSGHDWRRPFAATGGGRELTLGYAFADGWRFDAGVVDGIAGGNSDGAAGFMEGRAGDDTTIAGALTRTSADGGFVSLRLGERREAEGPFGSAGRGALALGEARTDHATLHVERPLGPDTTLLATAGLGWARLEGARDGLVADAGDFLATSFALGLRHEGLFSTGDALALTVAQPLRAENAKVDLDLPVARTIDGRILRRRHSFDAGSGGREIDLEATYGMALDAHREVELGLLVRRHPDHDDRAPAEFAAAVRYLHRF